MLSIITRRFAVVLLVAFWAGLPAHAFSPETHRRIVLDAVKFMRANPDVTNYQKLLNGVTKAGFSIDQFAQVIAQGAHDVDYFADTYICGAITGDCVGAPAWGLGTSIGRYTSFWHFQDHSHGADVHGNPFGGYNYSRIAIKGDIDELAAAWLWNDHLDDGSGGMEGVFGEDSRYNTYGITEKNYRLSGLSTPSMYSDFQKFPFQPISNLGQYWFKQFLAQPTAQTLGFVLHTTDVAVPHHTWNTLGNNHSGWETWVQAYYDSEQLGAFYLVRNALTKLPPLGKDATDVRPLLYKAGDFSYGAGVLALSSTDHGVRVLVGRSMVPHAIALAVRILDRAAERMAK
ncbi:phospholipase [Aquabacterium humicola]|uniref:phospholipase n=1 Tax=Aquabacterium humicola TaxID=3237377 RepID=UPI0025437D52|nr:phospholipase [Rubrivivax pictus]